MIDFQHAELSPELENPMPEGKIPDVLFDYRAECKLLGQLVGQVARCEELFDFLAVDDFHYPSHQLALSRLRFQHGKAVDPRFADRLQQVTPTDKAAFVRIATEAAVPADIVPLVTRVTGLSSSRKLHAINEATCAALKAGGNGNAAIAEAARVYETELERTRRLGQILGLM
jgi:hypothetical protein